MFYFMTSFIATTYHLHKIRNNINK